VKAILNIEQGISNVEVGMVSDEGKVFGGTKTISNIEQGMSNDEVCAFQ
jgi:hypothetical protein